MTTVNHRKEALNTGEIMSEIRVKVSDHLQMYSMAVASGLIAAQNLLEDLPQALRQTPGVALALATITAEANARRAEVISKNMITIARAGHDIGRYKSIMFDPKTCELICEFYDPDLFDSEASN